MWLNTVTDDYYGLTTRDVELARQISAVARELGVHADPSAVQSLVIPIDALVIPEVLPFWCAVLGYEPRAHPPDMELGDPHNRWPIVCFGQMDAPSPQRNRIHIDVWVPPERAEVRVAAAIAAGGAPGNRPVRAGVVGAGRHRGQRGLRRHLVQQRLKVSGVVKLTREPLGPPRRVAGAANQAGTSMTTSTSYSQPTATRPPSGSSGVPHQPVRPPVASSALARLIGNSVSTG